MSKQFISEINNRAGLYVSGKDAQSFLQGLITNDIELVEENGLVYSCLLSPQGKFQHDFFISITDNGYLIDCEGGERVRDLLQKLKVFKLRSDVEFDTFENMKVFAGNHDAPDTAYTDPRHKDIGWRDYEIGHDQAEDQKKYDQHRVLLGIPEGSRDLIPGKSTLIESWLHKLNAVSFKKGCYMGQELTARMFYRGLAKKHLYPVTFSSQIFKEGDKIETPEGDMAGEIRSVYQKCGFALIKDKYFEALEGSRVSPLKLPWMDD